MEWVIIAILFAQSPARVGQLADDPGVAYDKIAHEAERGFRSDQGFVERFMANMRLSRLTLLSDAAHPAIEWEGSTDKGRVSATAMMPDLADPSVNTFSVTFEPARERAMSDALVAYFLSKSVVDLDHCRNPLSREIAPCASRIVKYLNSYLSDRAGGPTRRIASGGCQRLLKT
jgi:hypothetical protein